MSRRWPLRGAAALLAILIALQLVRRPDFTNPEASRAGTMQDHVEVPPDVDAILRRACYDCHSHETRWPWYARLAPVSWMVARDVRLGRIDLNFSDWSTDPVREPSPAQRLRGICSDLQRDIMPLRSYLLLHPDARLSAAEVERVCGWTEAVAVGGRAGNRPDRR